MIITGQPRSAKGADTDGPTTLDFSDIDFEDAIFDSVRQDYPDFSDWIRRSQSSSDKRRGFVFAGDSGTYRAVAVVKLGEGPNGEDRRGMKISTFKVAPEAEGIGYADKMLEAILQLALQQKIENIFITVPPGHEDMLRYLERAGFRRTPTSTKKREYIYSADLTNYERMYPYVNRLAYDILASEYEVRAKNPGPSQEDPGALAELLTSAIEGSCKRLLELGPGAGSVLAELERRGQHVIGVEISPAMAGLSTRRSPDSTIVVANARDIDFPPGHFDGIFAGAFLHLFPRKEAERIISQMARWTRPGGAILVNTSISNDSSESLDDKLDYMHRVARFRSRWSEPEFQEMLTSSGLRIIKRATTDERERRKYWVAYICGPSTGGD